MSMRACVAALSAVLVILVGGHVCVPAAVAAGASGAALPEELQSEDDDDLLEELESLDQPPTAALYATLLYENLHDKVSAENSNVLWHLLNAYMHRPLDARL